MKPSKRAAAPSLAPRGTVEPRGTGPTARYVGRVMVDGKKSPWVPLGLKSEMSEAAAKQKLGRLIELGEKQGDVLGAIEEARRQAGIAPTRATTITPKASETVKGFGGDWTSGELFKRHGNVNSLRVKADAKTDAWRLEAYVYPLVGGKRVADVTEQDVERILAKLPTETSAETRKKIRSILHRLFDLAIVPGRLRKDNPVTRHTRPSKGPAKLFSYLFPTEVLALLKTTKIPLGRRVLYALACYTGLRKGTLLALRWRDVDEEHGTVAALVTKTDVPQMFEVSPDLAKVLRRWKKRRGAGADDLVVADLDLDEKREGRNGLRRREAGALRDDLELAGVTRAILFSDEPNVEKLRFHDLRATFVTWAKRAGKGEGWISDRTGHLDRKMIDRYSRAARTLADLRMDPFPPLDNAIPELADPLPTGLPTPPGNEGLGHEPSGEGGGFVRQNKPSRRAAEHSGSSDRKVVGVQVPLFAQASKQGEIDDRSDIAEGTEDGRVGSPVGRVPADPLEHALLLAAAAGRFDVVAQLAEEIRARRLAADGVIAIDRARRGGAT